MVQSRPRSAERPHRQPGGQAHGPRAGGRCRAARLRPILLRTVRAQGGRGLSRHRHLSAVHGAPQHHGQGRPAGIHLPIGPAEEPEDSLRAIAHRRVRRHVRHAARPRPRPDRRQPAHALRRPARGRPRSALPEAARRLARSGLDLPAASSSTSRRSGSASWAATWISPRTSTWTGAIAASCG